MHTKNSQSQCTIVGYRLLDVSVVHVLSQMWWQPFHRWRPEAEKLSSLKLLCVRGMTHILSDVNQSQGQAVSARSWLSEARYVGVCPADAWWFRHASLNLTLQQTGSQCNFRRTDVTCSHRPILVTRRVVVFGTDCIFFATSCWPCYRTANYSSPGGT